jgi:TolB-like protein
LRAWLVLLAAAAVVSDPSAARAEGPRIAVLPVVVHSLEDGSYLRAGMSDMLASRLAQYREVSVVRVEDPVRATTDLEAARAAARELGAAFVVYGSFTRFGDGASLDLYCAPTGGSADARRIFVQSGTLAEIIPKLGDVTQRVTRYVVHGVPPEAPSVSAAPPAASAVPAAASDAQLQRRIEALERAVFPDQIGGPGGVSVEDRAARDQEVDSARREPVR